MYILDHQKQVTAISMLCEGMGIRAAGRVVGSHRDTIMQLGRNVSYYNLCWKHESIDITPASPWLTLTINHRDRGA